MNSPKRPLTGTQGQPVRTLQCTPPRPSPRSAPLPILQPHHRYQVGLGLPLNPSQHGWLSAWAPRTAFQVYLTWVALSPFLVLHFIFVPVDQLDVNISPGSSLTHFLYFIVIWSDSLLWWKNWSLGSLWEAVAFIDPPSYQFLCQFLKENVIRWLVFYFLLCHPLTSSGWAHWTYSPGLAPYGPSRLLALFCPRHTAFWLPLVHSTSQLYPITAVLWPEHGAFLAHLYALSCSQGTLTHVWGALTSGTSASSCLRLWCLCLDSSPATTHPMILVPLGSVSGPPALPHGTLLSLAILSFFFTYC